MTEEGEGGGGIYYLNRIFLLLLFYCDYYLVQEYFIGACIQMCYLTNLSIYWLYYNCVVSNIKKNTLNSSMVNFVYHYVTFTYIILWISINNYIIYMV